jgi:hypothetical protein
MVRSGQTRPVWECHETAQTLKAPCTLLADEIVDVCTSILEASLTAVVSCLPPGK